MISTKDLARGIERVQKEKGWSRARTLAWFQISAPTFCRWKAGLNGPSIDTYFRVTAKLASVESKAASDAAEKPAAESPKKNKK